MFSDSERPKRVNDETHYVLKKVKNWEKHFAFKKHRVGLLVKSYESYG